MMRDAAVAVAARLGLPLEIIEVSVPPGSSPENQARIARYQALFEELKPDEVLCTGHTADDQAETVVANLLRGTGLEGLTGMRAERALRYRPLLSASRTEVRKLADELGLPYVDDPANFDEAYHRVAIRRWLSRLGPDSSQHLAQTVARLAPDSEHLEQLAAAVPIWVSARGVRVAVAEVVTRPAAVGSRVLRKLTRAAHPPYAGDAAELERLIAVAKREARRTQIAGGRLARVAGPWLEIVSDAPLPAAIVWNLSESVRFGGYFFEAKSVERAMLRPLGRWTMHLSPPRSDLEIRGALPTDRIRMVRGHKAVWGALAEIGVPAEDRSAYPVVETESQVIWVPGVRTDPSVWPEAADGGYLCLTARREPIWHLSAP